MSNRLGKLFSITVFGESHGACIGVVIDGCPAGLPLKLEDIQKELDKRKPLSGTGSTQRHERDEAEILSGIFNGYTTGAALCLLLRNKDTDPATYEKMRLIPRPGHADYTAYVKYAAFNDYRGGGMFSGRITAAFVMAGAVALKLLQYSGIEVLAHAVEIGGIKAEAVSLDAIRKNAEKNPCRCADVRTATAMAQAINRARRAGDSLGGIIESLALNVPAGLGEPLFDTMEGNLAKALLAIPAVKGVEFGSGFAAARAKGSQNNDPFSSKDGKVITLSNNSGGTLGGISNGMPIVTRVAVKPTPSISLRQDTLDLKTGKKVSLSVQGRHDACIVPRAVVVVKCITALVLCDLALQAQIIPRIIK